MILLLLFHFFLSICAGDMHGIYISPIKMTLRENHLSGELRIFEDDLKDALRNYSQANTSDWEVLAVHLENYLSKHFRLTIDNKNITLQFNVTTHDETLVIVQYKAEIATDYHKISLLADYLFELFVDQKNVLSASSALGDSVKSSHLLFDKSHPQQEIKI